MPVKQRQPKSRIEQLPDVIRRYLLDEVSYEEGLKQIREDVELYSGEVHIAYLQLNWPTLSANGNNERQIWARYGEELLAQYVEEHPGLRPAAWWRVAAPKASDAEMLEAGCSPRHFWFDPDRQDERPPAPRRRFGGVGTPLAKCLPAYAPCFWCGLPYPWLTAEVFNHYKGVLPGIPIDPSNPPVFESEAAYLKRHGLFLPGEEARLTESDFAPQRLPDDYR